MLFKLNFIFAFCIQYAYYASYFFYYVQYIQYYSWFSFPSVRLVYIYI